MVGAGPGCLFLEGGMVYSPRGLLLFCSDLSRWLCSQPDGNPASGLNRFLEQQWGRRSFTVQSQTAVWCVCDTWQDFHLLLACCSISDEGSRKMECGGGRGGCIKVTVEKQIFAPWPLGGAVGSLGGGYLFF